ncbi:MAG: hypothetical protein ACRDRN_10320 [Sciscionella sp.]
MTSIIDEAIMSAAGTLAKDLEPAAVATLQDLKAYVHGQADRLRIALPALEQKALEHVRSISDAVLSEYENVLGKIDEHLTGTTAPTVPAVPVDPTQAAAAHVSSTPSSAPSENSGNTSSVTAAPTTDTPGV